MAAPDGSVDLRSDTATRPTAAMYAAMVDAPVGDAAAGEDPTVRRLEELAAERVGKEAAIYVPSGTMANQIALRVLARPGTEVVCGARAHIYRYENAASAVNAGVQIRPLPDPGGAFAPDVLAGALHSADYHQPRVSLVAIENTHMPSGGWPQPPAWVEAVGSVAAEAGVAVHCDGARIFNAAVALGIPAPDLCAPVTTVMFCASKGLGAPVGSLLCGPADVIGAAFEHRQRLGGTMRQAGVIAAAALVGLETGVERLADDHRRAAGLAEALAEIFPGSVDPATVHTNIVCAATAALPADLLLRLVAVGIRAGTIDGATTRFVTHCDVDDEDLRRVVAALRDIGVART
ncbi:MAG: aminotransferase class I/II-fold pyridoxal phosphate-dependent enzyme [Actinomycetia bacterium]|nr:aminotransferase class I/II-fold pyridoxal phosphate-dependent enzyme [Actinomycetes bacterium]